MKRRSFDENYYKIDDLVEMLKKIREDVGNIPVLLADWSEGYERPTPFWSIDVRNVSNAYFDQKAVVLNQ